MNNTIDDSIVLDSYPGIFSQIFSNLIMNSIKHAFNEGEDNIINISMELTDQLHYKLPG